jgi:filamentous hemagglutinin
VGWGVAGAASFSVGQDLVFLGDALFYGPLAATRVGRTLDSRTRLQVGGDLLLDIAGDFVSEGLLQSTGGVRIQARNITTNLARAGGIVANGDIELVVRDLGQLGALGSVSSSGGSVLLSGSRFSNAGDVIAGGAGLVFSGGTLSNAGQIAAETVRVTGALDNHRAVYGEAISVSGYTTNRGAIAGTALSFDGGLGNAGVIAGRTVSASGTVSNNGEISGDTVSLSGGVVANSGLVSASHVAIQAAELGNQGTLSAGSLDVRTLGAFTNGGSVLVGGNADIVADGGFVNQLAEVSPLHHACRLQSSARVATAAATRPRQGFPFRADPWGAGRGRATHALRRQGGEPWRHPGRRHPHGPRPGCPRQCAQ